MAATEAGAYGDLLKVSSAEATTLSGFEGIRIVELFSAFGQTFALAEPGRILPVLNSSSSDEQPAGKQVNYVGLVNRGRLELDLSSLDHDSICSDHEFFKATVGRSFIVAIIKKDRSLYSIGSSEAGELGLGHAKHTFKFRKVIGTINRRFKDVACGDGHVMALSEDGGVYTWGKGFCGQLGHGTLSKSSRNFSAERLVRSVPRYVQALVSVKVLKIACGDAFSCVLSDSGQVWTWGEGRLGQLGDGSHKNRCVPLVVLSPSPERGENDSPKELIVDISCGGAHVLAREVTGNIFSWGFNYYGQLGLNDCRTRSNPEALPGTTLFASISANGNSSAAVCVDGRGWQWGLTEQGQQSSPMALKGVEEADAISMLHAGKLPIALIPLSISSLSPEIGSSSGGTKITLYGKGLWNSTSWKARFTSEPKTQPPETASVDDEIIEEAEVEHSAPDTSWSNIEPQLSELMTSEECSSYTVDCTFEQGRLTCYAPAHLRDESMIVEVSEDGETFLRASNNFEYVHDIEVLSFSPKNCCTSDGSEDNMPLVISIRAKHVLEVSTAVLRFTSENGRLYDIPVKRYLLDGRPSDERQIEFCIDPKALFRRLRGQTASQYGMLKAKITLSNNKQEFYGQDDEFCLLNVNVLELSPLAYKFESGNIIHRESSSMRVVVGGIKDFAYETSSVLLRFKCGSNVTREIQSTSFEALATETTQVLFQVAGADLAELGLSLDVVASISHVQFSFNSGLDWITSTNTIYFYSDLLGEPDADLIYESGGLIEIPILADIGGIHPAARLSIEDGAGDLRILEVEHDRNENVLKCSIPALTNVKEESYSAESMTVPASPCSLQLAINGTDFLEALPLRLMRLPHFVSMMAVQDDDLNLSVEVLGRGFVATKEIKLEIKMFGTSEDGDSVVERCFNGIAEIVKVEEQMKQSKSKQSKTIPELSHNADNEKLVCMLDVGYECNGFSLTAKVSFNGVHFIEVQTSERSVIQSKTKR